jgi:cysteine-rich repeat protein
VIHKEAAMKRRTAWLLAIALVASAEIARADKKVTLCHLPPGNEAAVASHLAHGDLLGACTSGCPASCDDGNLCTSDSCGANGECVHSPVSCDDGLVCTLDACDPSVGCLRLPNDGQSCDDGNGCTDADVCGGTECRGTAIAGCCASDLDCSDADPCTEDACFLGRCQNPARSCAVENKCLAGYCNANADGACETTEVSCDDSNVCTDDACDGAIDAADPDCFRCGDGVVQPPEECDDANENPFDGCDHCISVNIDPG